MLNLTHQSNSGISFIDPHRVLGSTEVITLVFLWRMRNGMVRFVEPSSQCDPDLHPVGHRLNLQQILMEGVSKNSRIFKE